MDTENKNITLSKPLKLQNGNEISELSFNFESLSTSDFMQVKILEGQIIDKHSVDAGSMAKPKNLSFEFHLASGFLAAVRGTDGLLVSDFTRIQMKDAMAIAERASFFWLGVD